MSLTLLNEVILPDDNQLIIEHDDSNKNLFINGIFMQAEVKNKNKRVYPLNEIQQAVTVARDLIKESNGIFGELDHPNTLQINLDRVSHVITEINMVGNNAVGKAKILNTPMGNIAKTLLESGVRMGVSSRGAGNVNESGGVSNFSFVTIDLVQNPSAPEARITPVYESKEVCSLAECMVHDPKAQQYLKAEIMKWVKNVLNK